MTLTAAAADGPALVRQGESAFERGAFGRAAALWEQALAEFRGSGQSEQEVATTLSLAGAYQALGQHRRALPLLESAVERTRTPEGASRAALALARLGAALTMTREFDRSEVMLREAEAKARAAQEPGVIAGILNDQGNLFMALQREAEALRAYGESAALARQAGDWALAVQALGNAAAVAARAGDQVSGDRFNTEALAEMERLPNGYSKGFLLITAAQTDLQLARQPGESRGRLLARGHQSLTTALSLAEGGQLPQIETFALGGLGQFYEADGQLPPAIGLTRRAVFTAQRNMLPEALYRWEWQLGRLLRSEGDTNAALAAYRRAVATLASIRNDISLGSGNLVFRGPFRQSEGPLYFELADLLLQQAADAPEPTAEQTLLQEARDTMEQLKAVELQDYLCDDCVEVVRAKTRSVETVDPQTAVIYFIALPTRTETLVGLGAGLRRYTLPIGADTLTQEVREFRRRLETRTSYEYLEPAQRLHQWLIRPLQEMLRTNGIHTLVFVPDGALRTIPFAALHDGERFLVEDYAVGVVPGLTLVEPRPIASDRARLLIAGLSEPVQNFPPLYFVTSELETIAPMFRSRTLLDRTFTLEQLQRRLSEEQYSIVHLASHGQFDRDVRKTFLLTHESKLTLNGLEAVIRPAQYRGRPVELLVLSACQTAAGDDRAALGLAGVAVKAGARSALATLWFVNDQSTSALVTEVYERLRTDPGISKARALQAAQLKLLQDRRYRHPCYWSPYLMIGNWL